MRASSASAGTSPPTTELTSATLRVAESPRQTKVRRTFAVSPGMASTIGAPSRWMRVQNTDSAFGVRLLTASRSAEMIGLTGARAGCAEVLADANNSIVVQSNVRMGDVGGGHCD